MRTKGNRHNPAIMRANGLGFVTEARRRESGMEPEENAVTELVLFVRNHEETFKYAQHIARAMQVKMKKGIYRSELAPKAWVNVTKMAAPAYEKEYGTVGDHVFTMADVRDAAKRLAADFEEDPTLFLSDEPDQMKEDVWADMADRAGMSEPEDSMTGPEQEYAEDVKAIKAIKAVLPSDWQIQTYDLSEDDGVVSVVVDAITERGISLQVWIDKSQLKVN